AGATTNFEGTAPDPCRSCEIVLPCACGKSFGGGAGRVSPSPPPQPASSAPPRAASKSSVARRRGMAGDHFRREVGGMGLGSWRPACRWAENLPPCLVFGPSTAGGCGPGELG